jgi:hypothetical protein
MMPPISLASENEGVLRNPIANATPDGIHFVYGSCLLLAYVLKAAIALKMAAKISMNIPLLSGSWPSPITGQR